MSRNQNEDSCGQRDYHRSFNRQVLFVYQLLNVSGIFLPSLLANDHLFANCKK